MFRLRKSSDQVRSRASQSNDAASILPRWSPSRADQDHLFINSPGMTTRHIRLDKPLMTIGCSPQNDIVLNDNDISPQHALLRQTTGGWRVEDLASANGTILNGSALSPNSPQRWSPYQPLQIASYTLRWSRAANRRGVLSIGTSQADSGRPVASDKVHEATLGRSIPYLAIFLIVIWFLVLLRIPILLPSLLASCLTFTAILITPGFLLADLITWRLGLDKVEQLALALPFGMAILALPGMTALLLHLTLTALTLGWFIISAVVIAIWVLARSGVPGFSRLFGSRSSLQARPSAPWAIDELLLLVFLIGLFAYILPTLSLSRIDGDAYAVNTFAVDALAGLPLNAKEPLFGTDLGPGVRMVFNQYLPLPYLWSSLAGLDSIALVSLFSRQILALWAVLAMYMLGKAAGNRRLGLITAAIQLLIYAAGPFWRGDNVSLYFFERINADKFMVMALLLPPCFALAIRFVRHGHPDAWLAAAVVAFATSTIHPFAAAMLALALVAFSGFHLLYHLRDRLARTRALGLVTLAVIVMLLPIMQLILARGEAPLAPSYPSSFYGWSVGEKMFPILPFFNVRGLDLYGPLPRLDQLQAEDANTSANPFLIWRFGVNINRQRLIVFDVNHYISDLRLLLEPPYLLALFLLLLLLKRIRDEPAVEFVTGTTLAILVVMFSPVVTPLIGSLVMPWILWRLIWLFPYPLIIALAAQQLLTRRARTAPPEDRHNPAPRRWFGINLPGPAERAQGVYRLPALILIIGLLASPAIMSHMQFLRDSSSSSYFYPTPQRIFDRLNALTGPDKQAMVLADQDLSVTLAAYVAGANILAHRVPTTSEIFPADQQDVALQRLIDQDAFFHTTYLTANSVNTLSRYNVRYVIASSGSDLDLQLRLAPQWFKWQLDDQSYSLYAVEALPNKSDTAIQGNEALAQRDWSEAGLLYKMALAQNPGDLMAMAGLAKIAEQQGQFEEAINWWQQALAQADLPILHDRLGQLYALRGDFESSGAEWENASRQAPDVARYHVGLGNACLYSGQDRCAEEQFAAAVDRRGLPDQAARLIEEADLWQQQGRFDRALPLYEKAVAIQPVRFNEYILESAYREAGHPEESEKLLKQLRTRSPFSTELAIVTANMLRTENRITEAAGLYLSTILFEQLQAQDTVETRLALAGLLLDAGRLDEADKVIEKTLALAPGSGEAHRLQGDLYRHQGEFDLAAAAYQRAFLLEPTLVSTYISLNSQLRQNNGRPEDWLRILQMAIRRNPNEPSLYLALGDEWQQQGDRKEAIDAYLSALENLDPDRFSGQFLPPSSRQGRAFVYSRLARIYEDEGQTITAFNYYQAMDAVAPNTPWTKIVLGDAWQRQNDIATAETYYEQALQSDPSYLIAYLKLAEAKETNGNSNEAAALRQIAMQLAESQLTQPLQNEDTSLLDQYLSLASLPVFSDEAQRPESAATNESDHLIRQMQSNEEEVMTLGLLTHLYQLSGQTGKAIELYQTRLAQGERTGLSQGLQAQYQKGLADLYLSQGQFDLAIDAYQQALRLDQWWSEARLGLSNALIGRGEREAAVQQLQKAVELAPGVLEVRLALANALVQQGNSDEAQATYESAVQDYPSSSQAKQVLAEFYASHKQPRAAIPLYQQALDRDPGDTKLYLALSQLWLTQGDASQAQAVLESGLNRVSNSTELRTALSTLFLQQNEQEKALAILSQGITQEGENTPLLLALGSYYSSRANYDQAAEWYQKAYNADPSSPTIQVALADLDFHLDNASEAISHYEQAVGLAPNTPSYWLALANAYQSAQRYEDAAMAYSRAIALEPDLTAAYIGQAEAMRAQSRWEDAQSSYERGLAVTPKSAWLLSAYAGFLLDRGEQTRSLALIQQAYENVQDVPTMVSIAALYDEVRQKETSEALLQTAIAQEPGSLVALIALGDLYEAQGRTSDAESLYKKVVALAPGMSTGYLRLGNLANKAGDQEAADEYASLAQQVAPESFRP